MRNANHGGHQKDQVEHRTAQNAQNDALAAVHGVYCLKMRGHIPERGVNRLVVPQPGQLRMRRSGLGIRDDLPGSPDALWQSAPGTRQPLLQGLPPHAQLFL